MPYALERPTIIEHYRGSRPLPAEEDFTLVLPRICTIYLHPIIFVEREKWTQFARCLLMHPHGGKLAWNIWSTWISAPPLPEQHWRYNTASTIQRVLLSYLSMNCFSFFFRNSWYVFRHHLHGNCTTWFIYGIGYLFYLYMRCLFSCCKLCPGSTFGPWWHFVGCKIILYCLLCFYVHRNQLKLLRWIVDCLDTTKLLATHQAKKYVWAIVRNRRITKLASWRCNL